MAEISVEASISRALRTLPQGRAYAPIHSLLSRILEDMRLIDTLISRAECMTKSTGRCLQNTCKTGCANIYYSREGDEIALWKVGSNSFSLRRTSRGFRISSKDFEILLEGKKIRVVLPSSKGEEVIEGDIGDSASMLKGYSVISYVLNKVEPLMRNALDNITRCIRERRLSC